eukprot:CAMPEP_0185777016 /NCGR_PEP_ID=MMETSP1174-20130828/87919_1 /TAXON_ID=35687 /ORGANISM="Dictyocha speculum, Strain CCMP1381" /LENGTH=32 /DNA_ID= /DNA_START= /DNA_END= /DNA_ORIENTATION=
MVRMRVIMVLEDGLKAAERSCAAHAMPRVETP